MRLSSVRHAAVTSWAASLTDIGLSASTIRQTHSVFSLLLALAVRDGRLPRNPPAGVVLPRVHQAEHIHLSHAQVAALANVAGRYKMAIQFLAYTGVRYGELAVLRASQVDFTRRRVAIAEAVADVNGHAVVTLRSIGSDSSASRRIPRCIASDRVWRERQGRAAHAWP